jgi:hypothetical protein
MRCPAAMTFLGLAAATGGDEVFFQLVATRIIEPVSKLDSLRVLEEAGITPAPYRTVTRRLRVFAQDSWRQCGGRFLLYRLIRAHADP